MDAAFDWNGLAALLAVSRGASLASAARAMGVDATTVGRRLAQLEASVGAPLFHRGRRGREVNELGARLVAVAEETERRMAEARRGAAVEHQAPEGVVRVSASEWIGVHLVAPHLGALRAQHPRLAIDLVLTATVLDLARGEADIALRLSRPEEPELVRRRLCTMGSSVWASKEFLRARAMTAQRLDAARLDRVAYTTPAEERWIERVLPGAPVALRVANIAAALAAVVGGVGAAVLPDGQAAAAGLVRLHVGVPPQRAVWMAMHPETARVPRVRAVARFFEATMAALSASGT